MRRPKPQRSNLMKDELEKEKVKVILPILVPRLAC